MATTIQISQDLLKELKARKINDNDTYEEIIWDALEDTMELSEQTKSDIEKSRQEYQKGKFSTLSEVKARLGFQ